MLGFRSEFDTVHVNNSKIGIVVMEGVDCTLCLIDHKKHSALDASSHSAMWANVVRLLFRDFRVFRGSIYRVD